MNSLKFIFIKFLVLVSSVYSFANSIIPPDLDKIISNPVLKGSIIGISVTDASNHSTYNHNAELLLIPASTMKIVTTFSAIEKLGKDYVYETQVFYDGIIDRSGTLSGNLWIVGSGDPSLGSPRDEIGQNFQAVLKKITVAIQKSGINCIDGKIILQNTRFDQEMAHPNWPWSDVGNYYGGGVSGLNINENEYTAHFNTNKSKGEQADLQFISPSVPFLKLNSEVIIEHHTSGDNAYIFGGPGNYEKIIRGTLPLGYADFKIKGSLPNPSEFFLHHLSEVFTLNNISHHGYAINFPDNDERKTLLLKIASPKLSELATLANEKSINLYCEAFLKSITNEGSRESAIREIYDQLDQYNLDTFLIQMEDGSGLSSRNMISPKFLTGFLNHYSRKWGIEFCTSLLPQISRQGTVRGLLKNSPAEGKAFIKSGYIGKVLCYAGYVQSKSGQWNTVAIMINQYRCKTSEVRYLAEKIIEEIYLSS